MAIIKKITAKGFKSFAKHTELNFDNGFNCVIGPNGSGKSNIVDLITFVLGKTSAKQMRAEKSANLIYNGGKNNSPAKEAVASIVFDNSKSEFPIKEKQVKVTRIVRNNGNSIYKLNDKTMTRQQILEALTSAKIDPDGHNIILQGDIVHFMDMKTEDRRKIIEDISGISMYEDKKIKALSELDKVEEKLKEAGIILTERNAHLRELKKDRDQAIQYRDLEKNIKDNKATYINLQIKSKEDSKNEIEGKLKEQAVQKDKLQSAVDSIKGNINSIKEELNAINKDIEQRGEKEQIKISKEVEALKTTLIEKTNRLETLNNEISRINQRKTQLTSNIKELDAKIEGLQKELLSLSKQKSSIESEDSKLLNSIKSFKEKHGIIDEDELEKNIEDSQNNLFSLQNEKQVVLRALDRIAVQLEDTSKKLESSKDLADISKLKQEHKKTLDSLKEAMNNDLILTSRLSKARKDINAFEEELTKLNLQNFAVKENIAMDLATNKILKSGIKGIYSTVSDLGEVDNKYSLALEVAAGSRIKSIVVEDDLVAAKCIKYLKDNRLGVATFLPLNKIKGKQASESAKKLAGEAGVHGFATDLVNFNPKFKNVFYYVFGPTLVVDKIETARKIGIGTERMVTVEGDLIEVSGAMVGGHRMKKTGSFRQMDFSEKIKSLEEEKSKLKSAIDDLEKTKGTSEGSIMKLREQKAVLEGEMLKFEKTVGMFDLEKLTENKSELLKEEKENKAKLNDIEKQMAKLNKELESLKDKKTKLRSTKSKELVSLEEKKISARDRLANIENEIKSINTQINNLFIPEKKRTEQIIKDHDKELVDFEKEIKQLGEIIKNSKVSLKEKERQETKFYSDFKVLFNKRNKLNEVMQSKDLGLSREEEKIKAIEQKINNINLDRAKVVAELEGLQKEFEEFKDNKIKRGMNLDELRFEIQRCEKELNKLGNVNLRALEVYEELEKEYGRIMEKTDKLKSEKEDVLEMMKKIEADKGEVFMKTYKVIAGNFTRIFDSLSSKGPAVLELEDKENPFNGGIEIKVRITGNKYLDIKSLSGGEKTLAALGFIFAIQEHQPASFYLLDEVDAALDKANSEQLSKLIGQYSKGAQYIVISHNDNIITEAQQIYGVSMQQGISKVTSLKI